MSNEISNELKAQIFAQQSDDPFLTLITISHDDFDTIRLVNNSTDIVSNGNTFTAFPMKIRLPVDDGESARDIVIEFDNASLELIESLRSVTTAVDVRVDLILASMPDVIQLSHEDLVIKTITYNKNRVSARIAFDNFLSVAMTSERYNPSNFPGLFS